MLKIMFSKYFFAAAVALCTLSSCRPKPIAIDIPQKSGAISVSSVCIDEHTVFVSASYSANSLLALSDTSGGNHSSIIPRGLLIDSAIVTLHGSGGLSDTLRKLYDGVWGSNRLNLKPGATYQFTVLDCRKGTAAMATTIYNPRPSTDTLYAERIPVSGDDTLIKLRIRLKSVSPDSYFFVAYNTVRHARENAIPLPMNTKALNFFQPKQVELFNAEGVRDGMMDKAITLQVKPNDTLLVQLGQVDKAYYDYLSAYKRSGSLINQLTGEPINLPGNISGGYGYFSLYLPLRRICDLNRL